MAEVIIGYEKLYIPQKTTYKNVEYEHEEQQK